MGVTIHYKGKLRDRAAYDTVIVRAREFAQSQGWPHRDIPEEFRRLHRVRDEQDWDYEGSTKGIELLPHQDCEPVRLEFDRDLYIQEYTKTQFAPLDFHIAIVALLRALQPCFATLTVEDEGEYFESEDRAKLAGHVDWCNAAIEKIKPAKPAARAGVKLPGGRILDLYG
jgi:hypothetical protein